MKLGITTMGGDGGKSGISQYIINLLKALAAEPGGLEFEVVVYPDEAEMFVPDSSRFTSLTVSGAIRNPIRNILWHQMALPGLCRRRGWDALFLPAANRRVAWSVPCPMIGVVHDMSGLHVAEKYDPARMFYISKVLPAFIKRLDRVVTISTSSKNDIVGHCKYPAEKVDMIPLGVDLELYSPGDRVAAKERVAAQYGLSGRYLVYISRLEHPGKNHARLIKAFNLLKEQGFEDLKLVLVGGDWSRAEEVHALAEASPAAGDILFTGFAPTEILPDLYRAAEVMVFPSLYEGFGMPILEAMACGVPVAAANASSLPEVAGGAAELFDPLDEAAMAASIRKILEDDNLAGQLKNKGLARAAEHSWAATAARTRQSIETAAGL